jgi:hypothetical protein
MTDNTKRKFPLGKLPDDINELKALVEATYTRTDVYPIIGPEGLKIVKELLDTFEANKPLLKRKLAEKKAQDSSLKS